MKTRVLVVDDSALMRQLLRQILTDDPDIEVVGAAPDPIKAWELIQQTKPDVLTLDVEMPRMDGLEFLSRLMRARPMPVVMCSSLTESGCATTLRALELGAVDVVAKPKVDVQRGIESQAAEIVGKVKAAARARPRPRGSERLVRAAAPAAPAAPAARSQPPPVGEAVAAPVARPTGLVVAIGASTGGTEAILEVLEHLPGDAPGVVVVQHMPELFTRHFAERLDKLCAVRVREAKTGDRITPGQALIAPGGARHMEVTRSGGYPAVCLVDAPPVHHHRPSVDVLFESCARALGAKCIGVLLTGMGSDGATGLLSMRRAGARTVVQDESSCVVFGMPKEAIARGAAEVIVPLGAVTSAVLRFASEAGLRRSVAPVHH